MIDPTPSEPPSIEEIGDGELPVSTSPGQSNQPL
jgi:hypothetical protein